MVIFYSQSFLWSDELPLSLRAAVSVRGMRRNLTNRTERMLVVQLRLTDVPKVNSLVSHIQQHERVGRVQGHRHHRVLLLDAGIQNNHHPPPRLTT